MLDQNKGTLLNWIALFSFSNRPEGTLEALATLGKQFQHPWDIRPVLEALSNSPAPEAEIVLNKLAELNPEFLKNHEWFAALERRGTLTSAQILLDWICRDVSEIQGQGLDGWHFAKKLAAAMELHPEIRAEVYRRLQAPLPIRAKSILESATAESPDERGLMLLVDGYAHAGREFDGNLRRAVELLATGHRPSTEWVGAHEVVSVAVPGIRKALFGLVTVGSAAAQIAKACLISIDKLRDENGVAEGELRHPDIDTGLPWPILQ